MNKALYSILLPLLAVCIAGCVQSRADSQSQRPGPYVQKGYLILAAGHQAYDRWKTRYRVLSREQQILYCIDQLQNEQNPDCFAGDLLPDGMYTSDPQDSPRAELIRIGKEAIPYLIEALQRKEKTRIVPSRCSAEPWLVQDAALDVIQSIACRAFSDAIYNVGPEKSFLAALSGDEHNKLRAAVRAWWEDHKETDEVHWAETALMADRKEDASYRQWAARSLYARIGRKSYPILIRAYDRLPTGTDTYDRWDDVTLQKENILALLQKDPSSAEKEFLLRVLHDKPFSVGLDAARCLWALHDRTGLGQVLRETEEKLLSVRDDGWLRDNSSDLVGFFAWCGAPEANEMITKCLDAKNPYLRYSAIYEAPDLKMEKAVRKLPELFDDPFIINGSYQSTSSDKWVTVPPRHVCDGAAEAFNKVVPESPRFGGKTDEEQQKSVRMIREWWRANRESLVWNAKRGILELKRKPNTSLKSDKP